MTKITIPVDSATGPDGPLYSLVDNLNNQNSEISMTRDESGDNLIIDDSAASSGQKLEIDEATILSILAESGDIEGYLFGIKAPLTSANIDVPVGVPLRTNKVGDVKNFKDWFLPSSEVWKNTGSGKLIYYNNPDPSGHENLLASEAELIRQIDTNNYSFMTVAEVQAEVALVGWVKL